MVPTLFKFTEEEIDAIFGQQQNTLILFMKEDQQSEPWFKAFEEASKQHKGKMLFSYSDGTVDIQEKLADFMGVQPADAPTLRAIKPSSMSKYRFGGADDKTTELTVETLGAFIDSIIDGTA